MENNAVFVVLTILLSTTYCSYRPRGPKQYRTDYEYNKRTDSFYKLHTESQSGGGSSKLCLLEGAALMVPSSTEDLKQLHGMFKRYPDLADYVWVGMDGEKHEAADEQPIINLSTEGDEVPDLHSCDVVNRDGEIESCPCYMRFPFICKVKASDAPYDSHCDVYSSNYQYNGTVGSCYRIPRLAVSWNEAYAECRAQNAHLVVLNSATESAVVRDIIVATPKVEGSKAHWFLHAGFRANKPVGNETVVFKTIFNQTLEEAGFAEWSPNEPNNALSNEYCGTLFANDGKLNDVDCTHNFAFICEKEVRNTKV